LKRGKSVKGVEKGERGFYMEEVTLKVSEREESGRR